MKFAPILVGSLLAITSSCAQLRVKPATESSPGVHFLEPWPYLVVAEKTTDKGTEHTTSIVYLPRTNRRFAVTVEPGWGTVDGSVELRDGWMLSKVGSKIDSKGPETITSIAGLVTAAIGAKGAEKAGKLPPGIYRIEFDDKGFASALEPVFQ